MTIASGLRRAFTRKFDEELRFFKGWMDQPKAVGAILPTSAVTARRMASVIDLSSGLPVLELGPGTGVISRAILERGLAPERLTCVEYSADFVEHLRRLYPRVNVIEGDAFNLGPVLGPVAPAFDCVISGVPMLSFPVAQRVAYLEALLRRIPRGRPVVQITYGPLSPIPAGHGDYTVEHFDFVLRNVPPAQLWLYRRGRSN